MPRKKKVKINNDIKEKLNYIGLDLENLPDWTQEYSNLNFRVLKGYDEKKYRQYRFIPVKDIEILLTPTNRLDSLKDKYEKAMPISYYLDSENEENVLRFTTFMQMLEKVTVKEIAAVQVEQEKLAKSLPFKVKFTGNYLWQIYYSEATDKYFMLVPTEDSDYSTFFYLLKKKIENKKNEKVFVPICGGNYEEHILKRAEIRYLENYLWLFTKDYPLIYEVFDKKDEVALNIVGETTIYGKIKTLYRIKLANEKEAIKFYKLVRALFILQTELPHYYKFETNIDEKAKLSFYLDNVKIEYDILVEFITEQYLKSISLKKKADEDLIDYKMKYDILKKETERLEAEYLSKEKQISTYLECKKTFFGKVKYFFKYGKKTKVKDDVIKEETEFKANNKIKKAKEKFNLEQKNYTLSELEESYKELEEKEEKIKKLVMDINALKLKNKNLKKKIENASNYIEEINKHKRSIFEFWKYSNKDAVEALDEGEEEEFNVVKLEKTFSFDDDFEDFAQEADKNQRAKLTDQEQDACFIASTDILGLMNRINMQQAENKEISLELKKLKMEKEEYLDEMELTLDDDDFDFFGKLKQPSNKETTLGNKTHRELPRDKFEILGILKGTKGVELKRNLLEQIEQIKSALEKNTLKEDIYVYKACYDELDLDTIEKVSLSEERELQEILNGERVKGTIYLYKIKLPKGTNYVAFSNIIYYNNKNMTLPVGMNLSTKILVDLSTMDLENTANKTVRKVQFEEEHNDFSKVLIKEIEIQEFKQREYVEK